MSSNYRIVNHHDNQQPEKSDVMDTCSCQAGGVSYPKVSRTENNMCDMMNFCSCQTGGKKGNVSTDFDYKREGTIPRVNDSISSQAECTPTVHRNDGSSGKCKKIF